MASNDTRRGHEPRRFEADRVPLGDPPVALIGDVPGIDLRRTPGPGTLP